MTVKNLIRPFALAGIALAGSTLISAKAHGQIFDPYQKFNAGACVVVTNESGTWRGQVKGAEHIGPNGEQTGPNGAVRSYDVLPNNIASNPISRTSLQTVRPDQIKGCPERQPG